jgi:hypothetical protein
LQHLFGIRALPASDPARYLRVVDRETIGRGLSNESLQIHPETDAYAMEGGQDIARLDAKAGTATRAPAVVFNKYGRGTALAFTYNLPENIVYTRQGNPQSAGKEKDGILGIRAMDLFTHGFVDTTRNTLNQADEQMRLLTHAIEQMAVYTKPLPRFWYFPDSLRCVVTLNNDGEDSKEDEFLQQFQDVSEKGARMTLYVKEPQFIPAARIKAWTDAGFEISGHPDDTRQAAHPDWKTMDSVYSTLQERLTTVYGINSMKTITNHWFVWVGNQADGTPDFAAQAKIEALHGVGLDCNYAHYDNGSDQGHFLGARGTDQGNYTGSGLTMKFSDSKGRIIDVYQQLNNVYDQQYMEHRDQEGYFKAFQGLMDRSLNDGVYSSISVRAHNNEYFFSKVPLMKMLDYAHSHHVSVWTEETWLEFLQAKDGATFGDVSWSGSLLTFRVRSDRHFERDLSCLIPNAYHDQKLMSVNVDGVRQKVDVVKIKGVDYGRVQIRPGSDHDIEAHFE